MALHIRGLHKLKKKQGFVLMYALIALVLAMLVIALLVSSTTMFYNATNSKVGNTGAVAAIQSGIEMLEYRVNELLPVWYGTDTLEDVGIDNIIEIRQKIQEEIVGIDAENAVVGSSKHAVKVLNADINYREVEKNKYQRDNVSSGVTIYTCKDGMKLNTSGELEILVVGSYILNSEIYYKVATVTVVIEADEVDVTGIIKGIRFNITDYKEGLEGGTAKWGQVQ